MSIYMVSKYVRLFFVGVRVRFWNNQSNHPSVDCLTAGAMLCSLPWRREEAARPYMYSSLAKGVLKSELTSAGMRNITHMM
jgi:hypothetical protein